VALLPLQGTHEEQDRAEFDRYTVQTIIDVLEKSVLGRKLKSSSDKNTTTFVILDNQTAAIRKFETDINWNLLVP
jgi:hypothetical protein